MAWSSGSQGREIQMGLIPGFSEMKESVEEAIDLLRRAVGALEKLAAEQERANDLFAEVNQASLARAQNVTELSRWASASGLWGSFVPCNRLRFGNYIPTQCGVQALAHNPLQAQFLSSAENDGRVDGRTWQSPQADSTQSAHVRPDVSLLRLARAQLDEDPSVPGAREFLRRRAGRRQLLGDREAGVELLHRVPRDFGGPFVQTCQAVHIC
jgi:hypothetical protein